MASRPLARESNLDATRAEDSLPVTDAPPDAGFPESSVRMKRLISSFPSSTDEHEGRSPTDSFVRADRAEGDALDVSDVESSVRLRVGETKAQVSSSVLQRQQVVHAIGTLGMGFAALVAAVVAIPWMGVTAPDVALLGSMYALTMTGVAVGFHNLFAHRAFRAGRFTRAALAILGSMAGQGPVIYWATNHRLHHGKSDRKGDLHSPWVDANGEPSRGLRAFWHAHVGWILGHQPANPLRFSKDLLRDSVITWVNELYYVWLLLGLAVPSVLGWAFDGTRGLWSGLIWGGLARMCLVQHATFAGNSFCHWLGRQTYNTGDRSTDVVWLTIPTWGGALHNTHHAFPRSAALGTAWWHFDIGHWIIVVLERVGLVHDVQRVTPKQREALRHKALRG